jgi:hypothetical protein
MVSEDIRGMIPDYVRGLLAPEEAQVVANALSSNPELIKEVEAAQRYYSVLNQLPEPDVPPDFLERINKRIDQKPWLQNAIDLLFKPFFPKIPLEFAGVAACLIIVVIIFRPEFTTQQKTELPLAINTSTYISDESSQLAISQDKKQVPSPAPRPKIAAKSIERTAPPATSQPPEPKKAPAVVISKKKADDNIPVETAGTSTQATQTYRSSTSPLEEKAEMPMASKSLEEKPVTLAAVDIGYIELAYFSPSPDDRKLSEITSAQAPLARTEKSNKRAAAGKSKEFSESEPAAVAENFDSSLHDQNATAPIAISEILDPILMNYDSLFSVKTLNGKISYTLTLTPDRLSSLSKELQQSFAITSRLIPFDPLVTKQVTVSFIIRE